MKKLLFILLFLPCIAFGQFKLPPYVQSNTYLENTTPTYSITGYGVPNLTYLGLYMAPLASPVFTGIPAGPTAPAGTATTQLATTNFTAVAVTAYRISQTITTTTTIPTLSGTADYTYAANSTSQITVAIPANATQGARITLDALGTGGAKFTLNTGDVIVSVGGSTTSGTGSVTITQKSSITIECETTSSSGNTWVVKSAQGTINYN